jgi:DNA primase
MDLITLFDEKFGQETFQTCSNGQIKKRCPQCQHKSLSCNITVGVYNCFQCGFSGKLESNSKTISKIKKKFSQSLQTKFLETVLDHSVLKESHRRYLLNSGILYPEKWNLKSVPINVKSLFKQCPNSDLIKSGLFKESSAGIIPVQMFSTDNIIIPYYFNNKLVAAKTRSVILSTISKYKYMAFPESPTASYVYDCYIPGNTDLIITEGEKKAMISNSYGFSTCAFGGMNFTKEALKRLKGIVTKNKIKRLFIILDKDEDFDTSISAKIQACNLYEQFKTKACIVFLDQSNPEKVGLDDYLLKNGSKELEWILEETWKFREEEYQKWKTKI